MVEWIVAVATAATAVVAVAAIILTYNQSVGWKPLLVVKHGGLIERKSDFLARTAFEIWNRRRYPIIVRRMSVDYNKVKLQAVKDVSQGKPDPSWQIYFGMLRNDEEFVVEPGSRQAFDVTAFVIEEGEFPYGDASKMTVKVLCFDPVWRNRFVLSGPSQALDWGHPDFD